MVRNEAAKIWCLAVCLLICMPLLHGCDNSDKKAPEPTENANPTKTSRLRISVEEGSGVNGVEVRSIWGVGNIGCAPLHPISGAAIVKQVDVGEKVEKVGSFYEATIIDDRFMLDKCKWVGGAYDVRFMHDTTLLASAGLGPAQFDASGKVELTCIPPPHIPLCELRGKEAFDRAHFAGVFNATVETIK